MDEIQDNLSGNQVDKIIDTDEVDTCILLINNISSFLMLFMVIYNLEDSLD